MTKKTPAPNRNFFSNLLQTIAGISRDDQMKSDFLKSWRRRFGGTLLLLMYLLVFYIVVMCLTAYQIQTRVHASNEQGNRLSIWSIARTADLVAARDKRIKDLDFDLSVLNDELTAGQKNITELEQAIVDAQSRLDPKLANRNAQRQVSTDAEKNTSIPAAPAEAVIDVERLRNELNRLNSKKEKLKGLQQITDNQIKTAEKQRKKLIDDKELAKNEMRNYAQTADLIDELRFFDRSDSNYGAGILQRGLNYIFGSVEQYGKKRSSYLFVTLPSEVLIMLIVIAMGTMGSMISITQVFFAGEDRPTTFYLFRPLLGAVVAIGVYVIIKAGVIVASNIPVASDGTTKLNAFFVSFVSLVAGLMSESAIDTIRRAGTSFLRGDPVTETYRYASGVARAMADANRSATDLYPFFGVPPNVIDKWLAENETVPGDAQRVIAAWLQIPVRDLFSDIPPRKIVESNGS